MFSATFCRSYYFLSQISSSIYAPSPLAQLSSPYWSTQTWLSLLSSTLSFALESVKKKKKKIFLLLLMHTRKVYMSRLLSLFSHHGTSVKTSRSGTRYAKNEQRTRPLRDSQSELFFLISLGVGVKPVQQVRLTYPHRRPPSVSR